MMTGIFEKYSTPRQYRIVSSLLVGVIALSLGLPLLIKPQWGWTLLAFVIGAALYIGLTLLTYFRLRDASLSGWWLLPLVLQFNIGPKWFSADWEWSHISFYPSGLICLIPIIIGWVAATRKPQDPVAFKRLEGSIVDSQ